MPAEVSREPTSRPPTAAQPFALRIDLKGETAELDFRARSHGAAFSLCKIVVRRARAEPQLTSSPPRRTISPMPTGDRPLLVAIPTYNERGNIEGLLKWLLALYPAAHVVVIDDASPTGPASWWLPACGRTPEST
jgi:hypothetical protein